MPVAENENDAPKAIGRLKWLDPNRERARRSRKHEERVAKELGGKRIARSGARTWLRRGGSKVDGGASITEGGDLKTKDFHFEHKRTQKKSIAISRTWLEQIFVAARARFKDPGLIVTFEKATKAPEDWVMVPMDVWKRLTDGK